MYALKFHSIPFLCLLPSLREHSDTVPCSLRLLHSFILEHDFFPFLFGYQPKLPACGNEKLWGEKDVHKEV